MLGKGLNGNQLKLVAVLSMLMDHMGLVLFWQWDTLYYVSRAIGRMAFPIFCFLLVEGFLHTRNWKRYAMRLLLFAVISEPAFDFMVFGKLVDWSAQSIYVTLFFAMLMMAGIQTAEERVAKQNLFLAKAAAILAACVLAWVCRSDYSYEGILLVAILYECRHDRKRQVLAGGFWHIIGTFQNVSSALGIAAGSLILLTYDGSRGSKRFQYLFYWFYPVHMAVLGIVGMLLFAP